MTRHKALLLIIWKSRNRINNPNGARWNDRLWRVIVKALGRDA